MQACNISGETILPHRDPFLFLDRMLAYGDATSVGEVTFGPERDFFRGHFPSYPIVPGVVLLEAMCQSAAAGWLLSQGQAGGTNFILLFGGADKVKFRRQVRPGDRLETHAEVLRVRGGTARFRVEGMVDGALAVEAVLFCFIRNGEEA